MDTLFPQIHSIVETTRHCNENWMLDDIFMPSINPIPATVQLRSIIKLKSFTKTPLFIFLWIIKWLCHYRCQMTGRMRN